MWRLDKDTNQSQNVPTHFKNFNPYDILEPEKVNLKKNEDASTAVLIEFDDNANKCDNSVDLTLHGSFLDKVKKSEYDLLDLYQNIYVTPHEIKKKGDVRNQNSGLNNNTIKDSNIDFTELIEKAEHGQKLSQWKKYDINVKNAVKEISVPNLSKTNPTDLDHTYLNISRKEIPHPRVYKTYPKGSNYTDESVPQPSSLQKSTFSYNGILDSAISLKCAQLNLESDSKSKFSEPEPISEDEIDEFLKPKLKDTLLIKKSAPLAFDKAYNGFSALSLNTNGKHLSHTIENSASPLIEPKLHLTSVHHTNTKSSLTDLNSPSLYRLACQQESIPILHTVKLDPKAFKNRRIVKKDCEILGFTKGPDIFEKSIVLPKIMERLAKRKRVFDERKSVQFKLSLDTGEKRSYDKVNINSAVAQTNKSFEQYLITNSLLKQNEPGKLAYQTPTEFCKQDKRTKLVVNGFSNKEPSKLSYQMTAGFVSEPTKEVASHKVVSFCNTNETYKLAACQEVNALVEPKLSQTPDYYLEPDKSVKLEPKVLMEDCNAKRIIALKTRVALEKFVKTGKLAP